MLNAGKLAEFIQERKRTISYGCAFLVLAATAAAQYTLYQRGLYTKSGDESARIILAREWMEHKTRLQPEIWLPFPKYLTGMALEIHDDSMTAPWVANGIAGILLVPALGALAWALFRQRTIALFSMVLGACFGPRLAIAAVPWSESLYCLALLLALTCFARWLTTGRARYLWAVLICTFLSTGTRYEAWLISACIGGACIALLARDASRRRVYKFLASAGVVLAVAAFPLFWIGLWHVGSGHALGFLSASGNRYIELANKEHLFSKTFQDSMASQFLWQNGTSLNLLGSTAAIGLGRRPGLVRTWLIVPASSFAIMAVVSAAGLGLPSHNFWRIPVLWSLLLIPFTAYWAIEQAPNFGGTAWYGRLASRAILSVILVGVFLIQAGEMTRKSDMDALDAEAGQAVRGFLAREGDGGLTRVHIQGGRYHNLHVAVASGHPRAFLNPWHTSGEGSGKLLDISALRARGVGLIVLTRQEWDGLQGEGLRVSFENARWIVAECLPLPIPATEGPPSSVQR